MFVVEAYSITITSKANAKEDKKVYQVKKDGNGFYQVFRVEDAKKTAIGLTYSMGEALRLITKRGVA